MGVENIFNNPVARGTLKALDLKFNKLITAIRELDIAEGDEIVKTLKTEYIKRRTAVLTGNIDPEADITYTPIKRKKKETPAIAQEPAKPGTVKKDAAKKDAVKKETVKKDAVKKDAVKKDKAPKDDDDLT